MCLKTKACALTTLEDIISKLELIEGAINRTNNKKILTSLKEGDVIWGGGGAEGYLSFSEVQLAVFPYFHLLAFSISLMACIRAFSNCSTQTDGMYLLI